MIIYVLVRDLADEDLCTNEVTINTFSCLETAQNEMKKQFDENASLANHLASSFSEMQADYFEEGNMESNHLSWTIYQTELNQDITIEHQEGESEDEKLLADIKQYVADSIEDFSTMLDHAWSIVGECRCGMNQTDFGQQVIEAVENYCEDNELDTEEIYNKFGFDAEDYV